jgi:hypothetical protein
LTSLPCRTPSHSGSVGADAFHGVLRPYGVVSTRSPLTPGLPHPVRSACRFSQPLSGLLLRLPCGFVSPRRHPWDSRPSELSPLDEPAALPVGHCPLDVAFPSPCGPRIRGGPGARRTSLGSGRSRPRGRLQGFAPVESSFVTGLRLSPRPADALLDFYLSRVCPPSAIG